VLTRTQDNEEITERVAALDIGKAELMCCVRVPDEDRSGKRLQEVQACPTLTRSLWGLTRYRADLVAARTAEKQRAEKLLEDAQIKLSAVVTDIFGVSGQDMLAALAAGPG
jgi:hypothetical protein